MRAALVAATTAIAVATGCARFSATNDEPPITTAATTATSARAKAAPVASATSRPATSASARTAATTPARATASTTPAERALAGARLVEATLQPGRGEGEALFDLKLEGDGIAGTASATMRLATIDDPIGHKRRLAFHTLASALGSHVVPPCVERRVALGALGGELAGRRAALDLVRDRAAVENDGTVATLWMGLAPEASGAPWTAPSGGPLDPYGGGEPTRWSSWIESPDPAPEEVPSMARDWLEMIALDYLAATSHRRSVFVVREGGERGRAIGLVLFDNANAFSPAPAPTASTALLRRLVAAQRFPRALRDRLRDLTPDRQKELFSAGSFERWLLPPRALVELEERRAALLSLIEAKALGRGEAAVLRD